MQGVKKLAKAADIDDAARRGLNEILAAEISGASVNAQRYRAKSRRRIEIASELTRRHMIDDDRATYVVTFWGLMNARSRLSQKTIRQCAAIYKAVSRHRSTQPDQVLLYEEIAKKTHIAIADITAASRYLARSPAGLGISADPQKPGVMGGEYYTQHTFNELKELSHSHYAPWNRPRPLPYGPEGWPRNDPPQLTASPSTAVREAWQKVLDRSPTDPAGAITAVRTLLENVCKYVLDETGQTYEAAESLPRLYKHVTRSLKLAPSAATEKYVRQVLAGCISIVDGLTHIRNALGDSHGHGDAGIRPARRHVDLVVGTANALATFLLATLDARRQP
jgi:hypothetical protein